MNIVGTVVQRALSRARHLTLSLGRLGRLIALVGIAIALFSSAPGSPAQAFPAAAPPDPTERLQYVVKSIHIFNDRDGWGGGEMTFIVNLCSGESNFVCGNGVRAWWDDKFDADSGSTKVMERVSPQNGDQLAGDASEAGGIPVYAGQRYRLFTTMWDRDTIGNDEMGVINVPVNAENGWGLGTYTVRSTHDDGSVGDYNVTYEIRRMSLPDLRISNMSESKSVDGDFYCVYVDNDGDQLSPAASLRITADGAVVKTATIPSLDLRAGTTTCVSRSELPPLQHTLQGVIDEEQAIMETHKANNTYQITVPALQAPSPTPIMTPTPTPTPNPKGKDKDKDTGKVDLTVQSVHVDSQGPDGKNGCKDTVTVLVKNGGEAAAERFVVRLTVDNGKGTSTDKTVTSLGAGQEQAITFEGIHLDPGQRTLKAVADPDHAASESKEGNNEGKTSARCKSDS